MDFGPITDAATALVAVAAFGLSVYNTIRARTPKPHWEHEWIVGRGDRQIIRDGIRFRLVNQGRGDAYDVTIEAKPASGSWAKVASSGVVGFGKSLTSALNHEGVRRSVVVEWSGVERTEVPVDPATVTDAVTIRVSWRQAPRTQVVRQKEYHLVLPRR